MGLFRNWQATLRPASYGGAPFYVTSDEIETGRRLDVHEFPLSDTPYVEDLGRKANTISVTAYLVSDNADVEEKALRAACESGGAKLLSLPMERLQAHCESCRRSFSKDKLGLVAFDMQFVREGRGPGLMPIGFLSALVGNLAGAAGEAAALSFSAFRGLRVPGFVHDLALEQVRTVAAIADNLAVTARLRDGRASTVARAAQVLYRDAESLTRAGVSAPVLTRTVYLAAGEADVSTAPLAAALFDLAQDAAAAVIGPEAIDTLVPLLTFAAETDSAASGWRGVAEANTAAIGRAVRSGTLTGFAMRVSETRYEDRRDAIQARADVAELIDIELGRLDAGRDHALARALTDIAGRTAEYLSRQIADLAPIVVVEAERRMPSLWWAQRLYGDAAKAAGLVSRNSVRHASFMPASFEATSA